MTRSPAATQVLLGGKPLDGPGFFYPPTVITDIDPSSQIVRTEIFGPVAALLPFDTTDEAIALANDTEFGLAAYVYTSDLTKGLQVSERIDSGMVGLNRGAVSDPAAPFGGMKQSGLGRELGPDALTSFTDVKNVFFSTED